MITPRFRLSPGRAAVLYDGQCRLCTAGMKRLVAFARPGAIEPVDFQKPGALDRFPGLRHDACMRRMHLVTPEGKVYAGFEAAVRAVATRPLFRVLAWLYYVPPIRFLFDQLYAFIAANRYRILGRTVDDCAEGTCASHLHPHAHSFLDKAPCPQPQ